MSDAELTALDQVRALIFDNEFRRPAGIRRSKNDDPHTQAMLDRMAQRGVIHRKQAARKKSRLSRRISQLESS
ncbi:MAG: 30S ribosomal protein S20 [Candidatus Hydrogenedentes bacterium]|nr:30S ribosomal protein S20 [Candidatus Hydrogenedentota bacterium]